MPWRPLTIVVARLMVSLSLAVPTSRLSVALRTMRLPRSTSCTAGAEALAVAPVIDRARFDAGWCWPAVAEAAAALLDGVRQGCRREKCLRVWVARALADRRRMVRVAGRRVRVQPDPLQRLCDLGA